MEKVRKTIVMTAQLGAELNKINVYDKDVSSVISKLFVCKTISDISNTGAMRLFEGLIDRYKASPSLKVVTVCKKMAKNNIFENVTSEILCECGEEINYRISICGVCGANTIFYKSKTLNTRSKEENAFSHFENTIDYAEGKCSLNISPANEAAIYSKVQACKTDSYGNLLDLSNLSSEEVRHILEKLGYSSYYKYHVHIKHLILYKFGIYRDPVIFTSSERETLMMLFVKCYDAFRIVRHDKNLLRSIGKTKMDNVINHPFILSKLLPFVTTKDRALAFRKQIILQSEETIDRLNKVWAAMQKIMKLDRIYECKTYKFY